MTKLTEAKIRELWKKYAYRLTKEMTKNVDVNDIKLSPAKYTKQELEELTRLIDEAGDEINRKFLAQVKKLSSSKKIAEVNLAAIKKNKSIYKSFVEKRDEHIKYFKKFPKYAESKLTEHLEESKEKVEFDAKKLANTLEMSQGINTRHAAFIARDQLCKFTASINEAQAEYVGAKAYIWRTSMDNRVRHEHAEREGKKFYYDNPPAGGNPGMDFQCRCVAEPLIYDEDFFK